MRECFNDLLSTTAERAQGGGPRFAAHAGHYLVCSFFLPEKTFAPVMTAKWTGAPLQLQVGGRTTMMAPTVVLRAAGSSTICRRTSGCATTSSSIAEATNGRRRSQYQYSFMILVVGTATSALPPLRRRWPFSRKCLALTCDRAACDHRTTSSERHVIWSLAPSEADGIAAARRNEH